MSSPIARILIGSMSSSQGLGVTIHGLGDQEDPAYASRINASTLRNHIASQWALLKDPVRPDIDGEIVFKLSRHMLEPGQIWTWLGIYRRQAFGATEREGTYIGCGLLALNQGFDAGEAVPWLRDGLQRLVDYTRNGRADDGRVNPVDRAPIDQILGRDIPAATPWGKTGLNPEREDGLFADTAHFAANDARFASEVIIFLNRAKTEVRLGQYGRVLIGNSTRLAIVAGKLDQIQTVTLDQRKSASTPTAKVQRRVAPAAGNMGSVTTSPADSDPLHYLRADVQALADKVDRMDNRLLALLPFDAKKNGPFDDRPRWESRHLFAVIGFVSLVLVGGMLLYRQYHDDRYAPVSVPTSSEATDTDNSNTLGNDAEGQGGETAVDAQAGTADCTQGRDIALLNRRPESLTDEALVRAQAACLDDRIRQLKAAADADRRRLDTLNAQFKIWDRHDTP